MRNSLLPGLEVGTLLYFSSASRTYGSLDLNYYDLIYGPEGTYTLSQGGPGLQFGAKAGFTSRVVRTNQPIITELGGTDFFLGPKVGYRLSLGKRFDISAEYSYLFGVKLMGGGDGFHQGHLVALYWL